MAEEKECDIFCCYRGAESSMTKNGGAYGLSEFLAKEFADFIREKNKENKDNITVKQLACHCSPDVSGGNFVHDIQPLIESAKFFVIFVYSGFTAGFFINGELNEKCVTAKELVTAASEWQKGRLKIITINIGGSEFSDEDAKNLKVLFDLKKVYWEKKGHEEINAVTVFTKANHNDFKIQELRKDEERREFFEKRYKALKIDLYGGYEVNETDGGLVLLKYNRDDADVTTPQELNGKKVIAFEPSTFAGNKNIKKLTISAGIQDVKSFSFANCELLKQIIVPITVKRLHYYSFCNGKDKNYSLINDDLKVFFERINVDACISSDKTLNYVLRYNVIKTDEGFDYVLHYGKAYLARCRVKSSNITIPAKIDGHEVVYVANIFDDMDNVDRITEITLPYGIENIDVNNFSILKNLSSISIDNESARYYSKNNCLIERDTQTLLIGTTTSVIPHRIKHIGDSAFERRNTKEIIFEENSELETIGDGAFACCNNLTSIALPSGLTSIGTSAFAVCMSLISITLPNSTTSIGKHAFSYCKCMTSIEIPSSVTNIGELAFYNCSNLTIYCEAESQPSEWDDDWNPDNRPVIWGYKSNN